MPEIHRTKEAKRWALKPWRRWYKLKIWLQRRDDQLRRQPLCQWCLARGRVTPATEAHHAEPHHGDWIKFTQGELVSLCKPCHDSEAQGIEARGYSQQIGLDGWPVDPRHPGGG